MKRQVVGITIAVVLAVVGTFALISYVRSAKDDAVKGEQLVKVYVLKDDIAKGTAVADFKSHLVLTDVPQRLVATDAVTDLQSIDTTHVAALALMKGEQLLADRIVDARTLVRVPAPEGLQEISISLTPERAVGGELKPGDTVGVLFSFQPFQLEASGAPTSSTVVTPATTVAPRSTPNMTHFTLHKVLVTAIQFSQQDATRSAEIKNASTDTTIDPSTAEAPSQQLLVTLAVSASEAEQLVFASEFGTVWLTAEGPNASEDGTRILTLDGVYVTVPR